MLWVWFGQEEIRRGKLYPFDWIGEKQGSWEITKKQANKKQKSHLVLDLKEILVLE